MEGEKLMKARSLLILLVLAVAAGLLCLTLARKSASEVKASAGIKPFESVPVNDSGRIVVRGADGECVVEKTGDKWVVPAKEGYPADFSKIGSLLRDIVELKTAQSIPGGESCLERFELSDPAKGGAKAGVEIQVFGKDAAKPLLSLRKGKPYKQSEGEEDQMAMMMGRGNPNESTRFAFLPESNAVVVIANPLRQASAKPADWLDKEFIKVSELKRVSLSEGGKNLWTIKRESPTTEWSIDGEIPAGFEFDKQGASSIGSAFSWLNFTDVAGRVSDKPAYGLEKPKVISLEAFDGFSYKFSVGDDKDGKVYATASLDFKPVPRVAPKDEKPEDAKKAEDEYAKKLSESKEKATKMSKVIDGWIYVFDKYSLEKPLSSRDKLVKAKPEEKKPEDVKKDGGAKANPVK